MNLIFDTEYKFAILGALQWTTDFHCGCKIGSQFSDPSMQNLILNQSFAESYDCIRNAVILIVLCSR